MNGEPSKTSESSKAALRTAVACFKRGDFLAAAAVLSPAIFSDPANPQLYDLRALVGLNLGNLDHSLRDAEKLIKLVPAGAKGYLHAGKALSLLGKNQRALAAYKIALRKVPPSDPRFKDLEYAYQSLLDSGDSTKVTPMQQSNGADLTDPTPERECGTLIFGHHDVPLELFHAICRYLSFPQIVSACRVSRRWRDCISANKVLWQDLDFTSARSLRVSTRAVQSSLAVAGRRLRSLVLPSCTNVAASCLDSLPLRCKTLKRLEFTNTSKVPAPAFAATFKRIGASLTTISLASTSADDLVLRNITDKCRQLTSLDVRGCTGLTHAAFDLYAKLLIREISIPLLNLAVSRTAFSDRSLSIVVEACSQLESLDLAYCNRVTRDGVVMLGRATNLRTVVCTGTDLGPSSSGAVSLEDAFLHFGEGCSELSDFSLSACPHLNDTSISYLAGLCTKLTRVDLSQSANITDAAVDALASDCASLRIVILNTCPRVSDCGFANLMTKQTGLVELHCGNNPSVGPLTLRAIATYGAELARLIMDNCPKLTGGV
ncbi:hypothetical protein HKX48_003778, partial [Thoreauomyces humboldtii]